MKKLLLSFFAIVLCVPALIFAGCAETPNALDMATYFKSEVNYTTYSGSNKTTLEKLTDNDHSDTDKYTLITVEGNSDWLYKMTIESVNFEVFSTTDEEVEFTIRFTNLKNGNQSVSGSTSVYQQTVSLSLEQNKTTAVKIDINDIVSSNSSTTKIEIKVDRSYYSGDNAESGFKFDIQNLQVYGAHK